MHNIMILAIIGLLWKIGVIKMVTMSLFYDPGPPKSTNGGPIHWPTTYWGNFGWVGLEGQNGFKTRIWAKMAIFKVFWRAFFNPKTFPLKS